MDDERFLRAVLRKIEREKRAAERILYHLDDVVDALQTVLREPTLLDQPARRREAKAQRRALSILDAIEPSVSSIKISFRSDGSALIRIEGRTLFRLRPAEAKLLSVISAGDRIDRDGLVAWRTYDDVMLALAKQEGRRIGRHALIARIHRLRLALEAANENWRLVQTRKGFIRFALRVTSRPEVQSR